MTQISTSLSHPYGLMDMAHPVSYAMRNSGSFSGGNTAEA